MFISDYFDNKWFPFGNRALYYLLPLAFVLCVTYLRRIPRKNLNLPKGPIGLPIVGYLPFLGKEPYKTLDQLKHKYGNVFSVYFGRKQVVILADYTAVEEAFSKTETANRPPGIFDLLPEGFGFAGTNGDVWTERRRFVLRTVRDLGLGKTTWTRLLEEEMSDFLDEISGENGKPVNINKLLNASIANNIYSFIFGRRLPRSTIQSVSAGSDAAMESFSQSGWSTYFPWLVKILTKIKLSHYYDTFQKIMFFHSHMRKEIDRYIKSSDLDDDGNFITEYLAAVRSNKRSGKETQLIEQGIVGDAQAIFTGASDTTRESLTWLFLIMANFKMEQEKVYAEIESVLGKHQMALWEDRKKLPYTYAVIMESQRWKTLLPINAGRMASEDIKICGYDIPKGTNIIGNYWSLHNDPKYWKEPEKFLPERFLQNHGKEIFLQNDGKEINMKQESYVPFSYGKRKCPGETIALVEIFVYFTSVMKMFEIRAPNGRKPNLEGTLGLLYQSLPQELCFIPRP